MGSRDAAGGTATGCDRLPTEGPAENPPHDSSTGQVDPPRKLPQLTPMKVPKLPRPSLAEVAMSEKVLEEEKQSPEATPSSPSPKSRRAWVSSADLECRPASASSENNRKSRQRTRSPSPRNQKTRISSFSSRNRKARTSSSSRNRKARTSSSSSRSGKGRTSSSSRNRRARTSSSSSSSLRRRSQKVKQKTFLDSGHHRINYLQSSYAFLVSETFQRLT